MGNDKLIKREGLPTGKMVLSESETQALIEHSRKLFRDGMASFTYGVLNMAAACYNFVKFSLYERMGYNNLEAAVEEEFGMHPRNVRKYREIGEQMAVHFGGGAITQPMIKEQLEMTVYQSRLGFSKIHALARTQDGIQRLLTAKSDEDLEELMTSLKDGASEIRAEMDAKPKTALKAAMNKRYSQQNPPEQTDITVLFTATIRQIDELNRKYLQKLQAAVTSIPPDLLRTSLKYPKKAQAMWNALREMEARLTEIADIWPDQVGEVGKLLTQVREVVDNQPEPEPKKRQRRIHIPAQFEEVDGEIDVDTDKLGDGKKVAAEILRSMDPFREVEDE